MTDTVQKLMALADGYALQEKFDYQNAMNGKPTEAAPTHRQALKDELVKLFTPLTDEQIGAIERGLPIDDYAHDLTRRVERLHGITGESK